MFGKSKANAAKVSKAAPKIATVIGKGTVISGDIRFAGGLHVDGKIVGNIFADEDASTTLTLSELGLIEGDIRVPNVVLNGEVEGNVYASSRVELAPKANIHGTVFYRFLEMQMGAVVNGQLIRTEEDMRMLGYDDSAKKNAPVAKPTPAQKPAPLGGQKVAEKAPLAKPAVSAQQAKPLGAAAMKPTAAPAPAPGATPVPATASVSAPAAEPADESKK